MKALGTALLLVLLINLLAVGGFVGWLVASDRVDRERVEAAVALFTPTLTESQQSEAESQAMAEQVAAEQTRLTRLAEVAAGPRSLDQRLLANKATDDYVRELLNRLSAENAAIRSRLEQDRRLLEERHEELTQRETLFDDRVETRLGRMRDEDFTKAVAAFEQLKPKQGKAALEALLNSGQRDEAIDYLATMQGRKSAAILREYKDPQEAGRVAELIEALRRRTQDLTEDQSGTTPLEEQPA